MWQYLAEHAKHYCFLGPIVGIVRLLLGATVAIELGWSRALDTWKPPVLSFGARLAAAGPAGYMKSSLTNARGSLALNCTRSNTRKK